MSAWRPKSRRFSRRGRAAAKALCLELGGQSLSGLFERTVALLADRWESVEAAEGIEAFLARR